MSTDLQLTLKEQYQELYDEHLAFSAATIRVAGKQYLKGAQTLIDWVEAQRATATEEDTKKLTRIALNLVAAQKAVEYMLKEVRRWGYGQQCCYKGEEA